MSSLDTLINRHFKSLREGESVRFVLVKGSTSSSSDPLLRQKHKNVSNQEVFPKVAKFGDSVQKPQFSSDLKDGRLYEEDVPKAVEEEDDAPTEENKGRKRWRARPRAPQRQWVLQTKMEFLETMVRRRKKTKTEDTDGTSDQYVGFPESNPSKYMAFGLSDETKAPDDDEDDNNGGPKERIQVTPLHGFLSFSQPAVVTKMSMSDAERAIQDQRSHMTRFMMHRKTTGKSKSRLLQKLKSKQDDDDDDDIMGDVAFTSRKGGRAARSELLNTLGDDVQVDTDGVLGGANDAEFGGKRHFGRWTANPDAKKKAAAAGTEPSTKGNDGMAMDDDFYQRDVQKEYEDLDYDANEQFDDDDVDVGEAEVLVENSGYGAEDAEEDSEEEIDEGDVGGAEGLASLAGFKAMLAKARGEDTGEKDATEGEDGNGAGKSASGDQHEKDVDKSTTPSKQLMDPTQQMQPGGGDSSGGGLDQVIAAAEKSAQKAKEKLQEKKKEVPVNAVDKDGLRVLSLEAIRREIWLHHGAIQMKRLMKIFDIKKKSGKERQNTFRELVKELCSIKADAVEGNMLVLKQHYSNMG